MTEALLVSLIACLCHPVSSKDTYLICIEEYTNCAIVDQGKILNREQFDKKCIKLVGHPECF